MRLQVFIKREGDKISLIVDGISAHSKRFPGEDKSRLTGPLYVGGVPPSLTVKHPDYTYRKFSLCIGISLQLNQQQHIIIRL